MYCNNLLKYLLSDNTTKDFTITAKDGKPINVHKAILLAKCVNLRTDEEALKRGSIEANVEASRSVELMLDFLYTGACALDSFNVVNVMCLGHEFGFGELVKATSGVITNELKLLNPNTAFILLDNLIRRVNTLNTITDPTPIITSELNLCNDIIKPVMEYIANNAYDVFMQTISYVTVNNIHFVPETLKVVLTYPYLSCSELQVIGLIDAWANCENAHESEETLKEIYGMLDLDRIPPKHLTRYKANPYISKTAYVGALESISAPLKGSASTKHRDHGRFAIGHTTHKYPGYRIVKDLDEFALFLPEVVRQYEYENIGIPLLENFTVARSSLGIMEGFVAVGWDPHPVLVKSQTVGFGKLGEHKGKLAELMIQGYPSLKSVPTSRNMWDVNPPFLSSRAQSGDNADRPALFIRSFKVEEEEEVKKEEEGNVEEGEGEKKEKVEEEKKEGKEEEEKVIEEEESKGGEEKMTDNEEEENKKDD